MHIVASKKELRALSSARHDEKDVSPEMLLDEMKLNPLEKHPLWADKKLQKTAMNTRGSVVRKVLGKTKKPHRRSIDDDLLTRHVTAAEWASY